MRCSVSQEQDEGGNRFMVTETPHRIEEEIDQTEEEIDGLDSTSEPWGDYPLDDILIRNENRTVYETIRKIDRGSFVMDPEFQRDFIWPKDKQSKLIESVIMRIPLPVFYLAEDDEGRGIVVDGLQRLSTFLRFRRDELKLRLPDRSELNGKSFSELPYKLQNRVEDCNLTFFIIDSRVPERARLDIFERVNSGVPLTRQQMRNSLFTGNATRFLKNESQTDLFLKATGGSLNTKSMRDREFVNRFCAFRILGYQNYRGDMDRFLADCLQKMNQMDELDLTSLSQSFRTSLATNTELFNEHAFRRSLRTNDNRSVLNASLWDVMSTGFSYYSRSRVEENANDIISRIHDLISDEDFTTAITYSTNHTQKVKKRFALAQLALEEVLGAYPD